MNAHEFFLKFLDEVRESTIITNEMLPNYPAMWGKKDILSIYKSQESVYTELINKYVIHKIIKEAGMKPQHEYFRIDTVGWVSQYERMSEEAKELDLNAHLWDLKIAVEHENSVKDWTDEIIKLIHIKCPLKVVIGYNYCKERGFTDQKKLDFIARWMQEVNALQKGTTEEYLVIFGNCYNPRLKADYDVFDYRGYLYNQLTHRFDKIQYKS